MIGNSQILKKFFLSLLCWFLVVPIMPSNLFSQEMMIEEALKIAPIALKKYISNMVNEKNVVNFNFKTLEEAKTAKLGDPYRVMLIELSSIKNYTSGAGLKPILRDSRKIWFPVEINGVIRTKMELVEKKGSWIPGEFGGIKSVEKIATTKDKLPKIIESKGIIKPYKLTLLEIPAMYAVFFYLDSSQGEYLIPAMIQPERYNLKNGSIYLANDVLVRLIDFAKKIEGNKVM